MSLKIIPVILAGGVGTRLWPLSRETFPKQFLRLISRYSLIQETILRIQALNDVHRPLIICNTNHYFMCHDHLKEINAEGFNFILEPFGKNTAPAIACAAKYILDHNEDETILLVLPSDHFIADQELFFEAVYRAKAVAEQNFLVTFGVVPTSPEIGYGYIQAGEQITSNCFSVKKFIEKPSLEIAKLLVENGNFYWNSGMFMFKPKVYLDELSQKSPAIYQAALDSMSKGDKQDDYIRLNPDIFANCPNDSIDYALMEKTNQAVVIPLASSWNDLGCWAAVAKSGICDNQNNVVHGEVLIKDSEDCFINSAGQMVAVLGIKNQIVVTTPDVVLVANKAYSQDVKLLVHQLKSHNSDLVAYHQKHYDSFGYTEHLANQDIFSIDHVMVKPKSSLSLPASAFPFCWLVVSGSAEILVDHQIHNLSIHQSLSMIEQLACDVRNVTDHPLHLLKIGIKPHSSISSITLNDKEEALL